MKSLKNVSLKDIHGKNIVDLRAEFEIKTEDEALRFYDFLSDHNLTFCDKCGDIQNSLTEVRYAGADFNFINEDDISSLKLLFPIIDNDIDGICICDDCLSTLNVEFIN